MMAATKYLDYDGLLYFWSLIKAKLALKADAQSVTAGSYGPSADASPAHSGTFKVPYVQVTSQGVVTAISEKTITLPASGNTDTKVNVTLDTTHKAYLLGVTTTPTSTAQALESVSDTGVYLDTTAGRLTATSFAGNGQNIALNTASRAVVTDSNKKLAVSSVTATELGYVSGVTSAIQTQLNGKAASATTLAGYGITDAYTKTEIDTKLTSAMHYKGSVAAVADLPASNNAVGDFYNVTATGENYAWTGSDWDVTGSIVDLQSITNTEIDTVVAS